MALPDDVDDWQPPDGFYTQVFDNLGIHDPKRQRKILSLCPYYGQTKQGLVSKITFWNKESEDQKLAYAVTAEKFQVWMKLKYEETHQKPWIESREEMRDWLMKNQGSGGER